jgi:hypothetical protein
MDLNNLTYKEAKAILSKHRGAQLMKMYTASEIDIIIKKSHRPNKIISEVISLTDTSGPVSIDIYDPPPLIQKAKNLANSVVGWARDGFKTVSDDIFWQRISICRTCPWWEEQDRKTIGMCKKCGCSTGKHRMAASQCPLNPPKWKPIK